MCLYKFIHSGKLPVRADKKTFLIPFIAQDIIQAPCLGEEPFFGVKPVWIINRQLYRCTAGLGKQSCLCPLCPVNTVRTAEIFAVAEIDVVLSKFVHIWYQICLKIVVLRCFGISCFYRFGKQQNQIGLIFRKRDFGLLRNNIVFLIKIRGNAFILVECYHVPHIHSKEDKHHAKQEPHKAQFYAPGIDPVSKSI